MTFDIKVAEECNKDKWNEVVALSPHGTIFHTWKWLKIVEKQTDSILYPLIAYQGTNIIGIYPIFLKKKGFINLAFSPPPKAYLIYLGPVIPNYENLKQDKKESIFIKLQDEVDRYLFSELNCKYVRIRSSPGLFDSRPFTWSGYNVEPLYTYRINLTNGPAHVWENFDRQLRVTINKTIREGVIVENGNKEDMEFIHSSSSRRYIEQGLKP